AEEAARRLGLVLDALAATVAAASRLVAALPQVAELDLNPVLASADGAVAVDVRIVGGGSSPRAPTAPAGMLVGG
ncbi:MAG: acetate--CoA ligase family protein, partial [Vicinamibacteria bacterium]